MISEWRAILSCVACTYDLYSENKRRQSDTILYNLEDKLQLINRQSLVFYFVNVLSSTPNQV